MPVSLSTCLITRTNNPLVTICGWSARRAARACLFLAVFPVLPGLFPLARLSRVPMSLFCQTVS